MRWFKFIENLIGRKPVAAQIKDISKWEIPICVSEPMWVTDVHLSTNTQKNQSNIDTSIFTPESATNWAKPSVVEEIVKNKVNKILFNDDTAIVSELLKQLMQSNGFKGEVVVSRSDISGVWKVTVALNGSIKKGKTVEKICMEILKKFDESKLDARTYHDNEVSFKHFVIEFQDIFHNGKMTFEIKNIKSLTEKEFHMIRDIFEKHVMANSDLESNQRIDEAIIVERLGLKDTDIVIIEEKKMEITAFTEDNTAIELDTLLRLANKLSTKSSCFEDTKFMSIHRDNYGYDLEDPKFNISVTTNQIHLPVEFDLIIKKKAITLVINLPNIGFDRKFLSGIFVPFFKEVRQLVSKKNQESITDYLIWMGVQVREVSEGEDRDLATLYEKNGFVGYEDVKEHIENGVVNAWQNKEKFEEIAKKKFKNIRDITPNAVLFEGPAGTGKTTLANIIGSHLNYPFVYIPINSFMSKWYGEAEKRLATIFEKIGELAEAKGGAVIMIDEIDEIGGNRESSHEASGKITGVLLKKLDGMERIKNILLIGATNREHMLDPALKSRFKYSQFFRLPHESEVTLIVRHYLPDIGDIPNELLTPYIGKISGRHIKNTCEDVTRIAIQNEINGKETDLLEVFLKSLARTATV